MSPYGSRVRENLSTHPKLQEVDVMNCAAVIDWRSLFLSGSSREAMMATFSDNHLSPRTPQFLELFGR